MHASDDDKFTEGDGEITAISSGFLSVLVNCRKF
jgi:hypothetical protein